MSPPSYSTRATRSQHFATHSPASRRTPPSHAWSDVGIRLAAVRFPFAAVPYAPHRVAVLHPSPLISGPAPVLRPAARSATPASPPSAPPPPRTTAAPRERAAPRTKASRR